MKKSIAIAMDFLEVTAGFEPADNGVADRGLTTWLRHQNLLCYNIIAKRGRFVKSFFGFCKNVFLLYIIYGSLLLYSLVFCVTRGMRRQCAVLRLKAVTKQIDRDGGASRSSEALKGR